MKIILANDHAATELKKEVLDYLEKRGVEVINLGTDGLDSVHYPIYAKNLVEEVLNHDCFGILICGSGIGVSMVANRFAGIRAALCKSVEEAKLSRMHNNANVLCLGARTTESTLVIPIIEAWLNTKFEGGRHQERVDMFDSLGQVKS